MPTTLTEIKENWVFTKNLGATSYWFEETDDGTGETIAPKEVLEIGCQLEAELDNTKKGVLSLTEKNTQLEAEKDAAFELLDVYEKENERLMDAIGNALYVEERGGKGMNYLRRALKESE